MLVQWSVCELFPGSASFSHISGGERKKPLFNVVYITHSLIDSGQWSCLYWVGGVDADKKLFLCALTDGGGAGFPTEGAH